MCTKAGTSFSNGSTLPKRDQEQSRTKTQTDVPRLSTGRFQMGSSAQAKDRASHNSRLRTNSSQSTGQSEEAADKRAACSNTWKSTEVQCKASETFTELLRFCAISTCCPLHPPTDDKRAWLQADCWLHIVTLCSTKCEITRQIAWSMSAGSSLNCSRRRHKNLGALHAV